MAEREDMIKGFYSYSLSNFSWKMFPVWLNLQIPAVTGDLAEIVPFFFFFPFLLTNTCPSLQGKPIQTPPKITHVSPVTKVTQVTPVTMPARTRMATRQQTSTYFEDDDEDMTDLQPTFSGPIIKWVTPLSTGSVRLNLAMCLRSPSLVV